MTRQPDWDIDRVTGENAEALVRTLRTTLLTPECEVKCDDQAAKTGNVYVEYECLGPNGWYPSGIADTKATTWAWVLFEMRVVFWMPVWLLKNIARPALDPKTLFPLPNGVRKGECKNGSHPTRGVLIPLDCLLSESRAAVNAYDQGRAA
jgi:hypothetical protein